MIKERNTSVEIFRMIATLLVLIVHFNGWFVDIPQNFTMDYPKFRIPQLLIESFSCVCVNCFLIITGFYGIRLNVKSIWNIYLMLVGIYVPLYVYDSCIINKTFDVFILLTNFLACTKESYFVNCYVMLMIVSPILNAFIEKYGKLILPYVIVLIVLEFYIDFVRGNVSIGFNSGYSLIHFIYMYMAARCCYLYFDKIKSIKCLYWLFGYVLCSLLVALMYIFSGRKAFSYSNPIVMFSSFSLFFVFALKKFYNKTLNCVARSSFSIYIIHTCPPIIGMLWNYDNYLITNNSYPVYLVKIFFVIIIVFIVGVIYDKLRNWCMKPIYRMGVCMIEKLPHKGVYFE